MFGERAVVASPVRECEEDAELVGAEPSKSAAELVGAEPSKSAADIATCVLDSPWCMGWTGCGSVWCVRCATWQRCVGVQRRGTLHKRPMQQMRCFCAAPLPRISKRCFCSHAPARAAMDVTKCTAVSLFDAAALRRCTAAEHITANEAQRMTEIARHF